MPTLSLLICRGKIAPLLRLDSSGGCIGYVSCSVLQYIFNEARKIVYILQFKRSTDRDEGFLQVR